MSLPVPSSGSKWQKRRSVAWPFLVAATTTWCSGYPATLPEVDWLSVDKIGHFGLYGALATAIVRNPGLKSWPLFGAWWAIILTSVYGLGDEFRQSLTLIRTCDWHDWMADTLGAITAVILYLRWAWYRRTMETPLDRKKPVAVTSAAVAEENGPIMSTASPTTEK